MRDGPRGRAFLLTSPGTWCWGGGGARVFSDFSARGRCVYHRKPIPPRDRRAAIIPEGLRRWVRRRATEAGGLLPAHADRNRERLSPHPFRAGGGPRANLAPRRIRVGRCVFPRPDSRRSSARCPNTDVSPLRPMSISARCMYIYVCTYSARRWARSRGPAPAAARIN